MITITAVLCMGADVRELAHWIGGQEGVSWSVGLDAGSGRDTLECTVADGADAEWVREELAGRDDVIAVSVS